MSDWEEIIVSEALCGRLRTEGYVSPTEVQKAVLPFASKHRQDLVIASQTGTGKTLCFGIPIIERFPTLSGHPKALVLTPTRELAMQIEAHLKKININDLNILSLVGGISKEKQERLLKRRPEVIIATPGRLWDFLNESKHEYLSELFQVEILVIDEADRMVEAGHFRELDKLLAFIYSPTPLTTKPSPVLKGNFEDLNYGEEIALESEDFYCEETDLKDVFVKEIQDFGEPEKEETYLKTDIKRQTFLVSATLTAQETAPIKRKKDAKSKEKQGEKTENCLEKLMKKIRFRGKPKVIDLTEGQKLPAQLIERAIKCSSEEKDSFLYCFLKDRTQEKTIIFTNTIITARRLVRLLRTLGLSAVHIDGKMRQGKRLKQLDRFRKSTSILVATDVAGRGLDLPHVQNVVHYQLPKTAEVYIHRSGRTARIAQTGFALSIIGPADVKLFHDIQTKINEQIPKYEVDQRRWKESVEAVQVALEIVDADTRTEIRKKSQAWNREAAEKMDMDEDQEEERKRGKEIGWKKRKALQNSLIDIQEREHTVGRASVITPEIYRLAMTKKII